MLKIDYKLKQVGTKKQFTISSDLREKLLEDSRRFTLTGKNGKGKSFLMNLLSYGLLQEQRVDDWFVSSISNKIASIGDESLYNLEYDFELIMTPEESIIGSMDSSGTRKVQFKKNGKIGAPISFTTLDKLIDVVYDIPVDINTRLESVLSNVSTDIKVLETDVRETIKKLADIKLSATDVRDEQRISSLERQLKSLDDLELTPKMSKLTRLKKSRERLNLLKTVGDYTKSLGELDRMTIELQKLNQRLKGKSKPKGSGDNQAEIEKLLAQARAIENEYRGDRDSVYSTLGTNEIVKQRIFDKCPDEFEMISGFLEPISLYTEKDVINASKILINCLEDIKIDLLNDESIKLAQNLDLVKMALRGLAQSAESEGMSLIFGKSLDEVIEAIEVKSSGLDKTNYNTYINNLVANIKRMYQPLSDLFRVNANIAKARKKTVLTEVDKKLLSLFEKRALLKKQKPLIENDTIKLRTILTKNLEDSSFIDDHEKMILLKSRMKNEDSISQYSSFPGFGLDRIAKDIRTLEGNISVLETKRNGYDKQITYEKAKPEAPFGKAVIAKLEHQIAMLSSLLIELESWGKTLTKYKNNSPFLDLTDSEQRLFEVLGRIIAHSFDGRLILDDGEVVNIENYNLLTKKFETSNDVFYSLDYLSNGISSSNYLRQKINQSEKPYILIFIDEIGDMDSESLSIVKDTIESVDDENRLLLALLATPSDNSELELNMF